MSDITGVLLADRNLTTMMKSLRIAGLEYDLQRNGPFTVFAPSEIAFGKLMPGMLTELLQPGNRIQLISMMLRHMIQGKKNFNDFTDGETLKTLEGKMLDVIVKNGTVTVNGATIQSRDKDASNGVVHSLDRVLV